MAAQTLLDGEGEALTRKAVELAKGGDMAALRLCMERIVPPARERPLTIKIPDTSTAAGINEAADAILQYVAKGVLMPAEGTILANIVERRRVALETQQLDERITALEKKDEE